MRRHDLLRIDPAVWEAMLLGYPDLATLPLIADWASKGWPAIVRRPMAGDNPDGVPAAVPLPPSCGKQRVGFSFPSDKGVVALPPVLLSDAATTAPLEWQEIVAKLLALGNSIGVAPRVFGALLWEYTTKLAYLTPTSDLDLLWSVGDQNTAVTLLAGLSRLDAESPVRLDGELELPDGGGVNWRELAAVADSTAAEVLVKSMDDVVTRPVADLFVRATVA